MFGASAQNGGPSSKGDRVVTASAATVWRQRACSRRFGDEGVGAAVKWRFETSVSDSSLTQLELISRDALVRQWVPVGGLRPLIAGFASVSDGGPAVLRNSCGIVWALPELTPLRWCGREVLRHVARASSEVCQGVLEDDLVTTDRFRPVDFVELAPCSRRAGGHFGGHVRGRAFGGCITLRRGARASARQASAWVARTRSLAEESQLAGLRLSLHSWRRWSAHTWLARRGRCRSTA